MELGLVGDYIAGLGLDAAKDYMGARIDQRRLKSALKQYIEKERQYNEICTLSEELDFQGVIDYITEDMLDELKTRFFSVKRKEREKAHYEILSQAVSYSGAETDEAKKRVARIIAISLEIVRHFFKNKISVSEYVLAAEVVDAVNENIDDKIDELTRTLSHIAEDETQEIAIKVDLLQQSLESGSLYAERVSRMLENGHVMQADREMQKLFAHMSTEHPLYPDYGFTVAGEQLKSKPLTESAYTRYPEKLSLKGTIRVGDHYFKNADSNPLDYAYRHQKKMIMSVSEAQKKLGDQLDPIQTDAEVLVGKEIAIYPPGFPEALPCAIKVGEKTFFDYILLRTQEILDDGSCVLGNKEQTGTNIYFEACVNPEKPEEPKFKINIRNGSNREQLEYATFMEELRRVKDFHIYVLSLQKDLMAGHIEDVNWRTGFSDIQEEIDFLERVCAIEDYFHVQLDIEGDITEHEYNAVVRISDLIRKEKVTTKWKQAVFRGILNDELRKNIEALKASEELSLSYVGKCQADLFGTVIEFEYMKTYQCAVIQDVDKLKKLATLMDNGDEIKIKVVPGKDDSALLTLHIPESINC